jgi:dihydroxy-acid dehydratase
VRDGDRITIDIPGRSIRLEIDDAELKSRLAGWGRPPARSFGGYLDIYSKLASSAAEGARLKLS